MSRPIRDALPGPARSLLAAGFAVPVLLACGPADPAAGTGATGNQVETEERQDAEPSTRPQSLLDTLLAEYDLENARFETSELLAPGVPKDGIPALTDPERAPVVGTEWPDAGARVIEVAIGDEAVAYPLAILNWHEIANDVVGDVPVAVTYCPLCDSAAVFDRTLEPEDGDDGGPVTLEFGVSGLLHNSNVVMYERETLGLWSQLEMRALSGPHAGRRLPSRPVRVVPFSTFTEDHPEGEVLTRNTGHDRAYDQDPYARYFADPDYVFPGVEYDDRLPPKVLGVGVIDGERTWFVTDRRLAEGPLVLELSAGEVVLRRGPAGIVVEQAPESVGTVQTFYHGWNAFHPDTAIMDVEEPATQPDAGGDGG